MVINLKAANALGFTAPIFAAWPWRRRVADVVERLR
jgi:hypothetical protein